MRQLSRLLPLQILFLTPAHAQPMQEGDRLPSPDAIFERHVDAIGGRPALEALTSVKTVGTFSLPDADLSGPIRILWAPPGSQHIELDLGGGQPRRSWTTDGERSWAYSAEALETFFDRELRDRIRRARLFPRLTWRDHYLDARTVGVETVGDQLCYHVELDDVDCRTIHQYYDIETGRETRTVDHVIVGGQSYRSQTDVLNYRNVDGILVPDRIRRKLDFGGPTSLQMYELDTIEIDVAHDAAIFSRPPDLEPLPTGVGEGRADLPSPQVIIDAHIDSAGGARAIEAITSVTIHGAFSQQGGAEQAITIIRRDPNEQHTTIGEGPGASMWVVDGAFVWIDRNGAFEVAGGIQEEQSIRRAAFRPHLRWKELYRESETMVVGIEDVNGSPAYRVRFRTFTCEDVEQYFDIESGLLVRVDESIIYASQQFRSQAYFGDYEEHAGVLMPMHTRRVLSGAGGRFVQFYRVETVQPNAEIDGSLFDRPPELRRQPIPQG